MTLDPIEIAALTKLALVCNALAAGLDDESAAREQRVLTQVLIDVVTRAAQAGSDCRPDLRAANVARQKEWDPSDKITLAYRGNELAGEVGEACNVIKKLERERLGIAGSRDTVAHLAEELADVVICADLIAMHEGIDLLGEAVPAKFNATSEKVGLKTRLASLANEPPRNHTKLEP